MSPQLIELLLRQLKGRFVRWLRMLRRPKYAIVTAFGLLYFWVAVGRHMAEAEDRLLIGLDWMEPFREAIYPLAAVLLAVLFTITWLRSSKRPRLGLTEAELHFLLAAPVSRRGLLRYALLKAQMMALLSATILAVFSRSWSLLPLYWLVLTLLDMHLKGRSFQQIRVAARPAMETRQRLMTVALLGLFWLLLVPQLIDVSQGFLAVLKESPDLGAAVTQQAQQLKSGLSGVLLVPFSSAVAPVFRFPGRSWFFFAALWLAHYGWVVHGTRDFEEASLRQVRQLATSREGHQRRRLAEETRRRIPFPLAAGGSPETAIAWKNWLLRRRTPLRRQALILLATIVVLFVVTRATGGPAALLFIETIVGVTALSFPLLTGLLFRHDFRTDLQRADILRSWPLRGWRLVLAEIQVPVVMATVQAAAGLALLLTVYDSVAHRADLSALSIFPEEASRTLAVALALGALPILAGLAALSSMVQNLAALLWPGWMPLGFMSRQQGPSVMGLWMLISMGHFLAMMLGMLAPVLALGALLVAQYWLLQMPFVAWQLPVMGMLVGVILALETAVLVLWGGRLWENLDPAQELIS